MRSGDSEDPAACGAARGDAGWRVLDHDTLLRRDAELLAGPQVALRVRLARPAPRAPLRARLAPPDVLTEHAPRGQRKPEPLKPLGGHGAAPRRCQRPWPGPDLFQQRSGPWQGRDPVLVSREQLVQTPPFRSRVESTPDFDDNVFGPPAEGGAPHNIHVESVALRPRGPHGPMNGHGVDQDSIDVKRNRTHTASMTPA